MLVLGSLGGMFGANLATHSGTLAGAERRRALGPGRAAGAVMGSKWARSAVAKKGSSGGSGGLGTVGPITYSTSTPPIWGAEFMNNTGVTPTAQQAVAQARRFDIIVANAWMYRNYVSQMRAANPNLKLYVYLIGTFAMNGGTGYPSDLYAHDAGGNKVKSVGYDNYLMDISNPVWTQDVVSRCKSLLATSHYGNGCFLDTMGTAPLEPGYMTGMPVDPATNKVWTKADWLSATTKIGQAVENAIGATHTLGNGVATGGKYYATDGGATSKILNGMTGSMVELFLRAPGAPVTYRQTESQWVQEIQMLRDSAAKGKQLFTMTKVWTAATQEQKDSWNRFALSSFLLGYTPGFDWFSFRYDHGPTFDNPYWDVRIGKPIGSYARFHGAYQRSFTNGKVIVDPSGVAVTVPISGTYRTLEGTRVSGSITLQPHTGEVLTRG